MNKDEYLRSMKQAIDDSVKENEKIQQFLVWLHEKTASLGSPYQESALRAFYCEVVEGLTSAHYTSTSEGAFVSVNRKISRTLDSKLDKDIDEARTVGLDLCRSEYDGIAYSSSKLHKIQLRRLIYYAETLPAVNIAFDKDAAIACKQPYISPSRLYPEGYLGRAIALLVRSSDWDFRRQLIYIMNTFPNAVEWGDYLYEIRLEEWRQWLSSCLYKHRNLKLDWQFSDKQKQMLNNYYTANKLLVDCLQASNVSQEVQKEIQDTLLLPIIEIERRKSGINKKLILDCSQESNASLKVQDTQDTLLPSVEIEKCSNNEVQQQVQKTLLLPTDETTQHKRDNEQNSHKLPVKTNFYPTTLFYGSLLIALILYIVFIIVSRHYI